MAHLYILKMEDIIHQPDGTAQMIRPCIISEREKCSINENSPETDMCCIRQMESDGRKFPVCGRHIIKEKPFTMIKMEQVCTGILMPAIQRANTGTQYGSMMQEVPDGSR